MRVILPHYLPDHARTFIEGTLWTVSTIKHGIQDTSVNWLQSVTNIWEGTANNNGHRIVQVGAFHLLLEIDLLNFVMHQVPLQDFSTSGFHGGILGVLRSFVTHNLVYSIPNICPIVSITGWSSLDGLDIEETNILGVLLDEVSS